ncbi:MAG: CRISPR-associated endonuclease Cas2 [Armatimonadetes bacterium]|nr:CRISPR-associated endonuclease Cas2 [Armatimonadota bacterium]
MDKFLVAYDTPDDRRRLRFATILDDYGDRVQFSVFEVTADEHSFKRLLARLEKVVEPAEDSVRIYPVCNACAQKVLRLGKQDPQPWWEPEVWVI